MHLDSLDWDAPTARRATRFVRSSKTDAPSWLVGGHKWSRDLARVYPGHNKPGLGARTKLINGRVGQRPRWSE